MGISFDENMWVERAVRRLRAAGSSEAEEQAALNKYVEDLTYIRNLSKVVEWCNGQRLLVEFVPRDGGDYWWEERRITVCKNTSLQYQLHVLLHECGHHLIGKPKPHKRFGMGYGNHEAAEKKTIHHKLDILEEEFEAWHLGWQLGRQLNVLKISDKQAFDKNRTRSLKLYVDWAAKSWKKPVTKKRK